MVSISWNYNSFRNRDMNRNRIIKFGSPNKNGRYQVYREGNGGHQIGTKNKMKMMKKNSVVV